jgi:hypothetical protein
VFRSIAVGAGYRRLRSWSGSRFVFQWGWFEEVGLGSWSRSRAFSLSWSPRRIGRTFSFSMGWGNRSLWSGSWSGSWS